MILSKQNFGLILANVLIPVALFVFAVGFFPYKPFLPGLSEHLVLPYGSKAPAIFDKVVFMVIDALRSDFVFDEYSGFSFTQKLINDGLALPFTSRAQAPTVTMPRLKSITTGSIPSFVDIILNIAESDTSSSLANQDTWLAQIKASGGKLVMHGDDTWLKLFPSTFHRADGTSSFFVADFTEVDNNVTRHVDDEFANDDWSALIMHYLGMDHIGHKSGPKSVNMLPKQKEMDDIVRTIFTAIETQSRLSDTLFVMCGDHGMNDGGNHGGSTPGETSPAMVLISPKLQKLSLSLAAPAKPIRDMDYYKVIEQSDIAPTISSLLGLPIPKNSLGVFMDDLLPLWPAQEHHVQVMLRNAFQILDIVKPAFSSLNFDDTDSKVDCASPTSSGEEIYCLWVDVKTSLQAYHAPYEDRKQNRDLISRLTKFCKVAQTVLSRSASNYDLSKMTVGIVLALIALVFSTVSLAFSQTNIRPVDRLYLILSACLYLLLMFASSYVEEEQQYWYWLSCAWIQLQAFKAGSGGWLITLPLLIFHRVLRRWNQSGQKYQGATDIANTFLGHEPSLLWISVGLTYVLITALIYKHTLRPLKLSRLVSLISASAISFSSLLFKLSFTQSDSPDLVTFFQFPRNLILLARIHFFILALNVGLVASLRTRRSGMEGAARYGPLVLAFLATQSRALNIPAILLIIFQQRVISKHQASAVSRAFGTLLLSHSAFFAFGNTNSIATIDLASAYNGLESFLLPGVAILLTGSTFAGPLSHTFAAGLGSSRTKAGLDSDVVMGEGKAAAQLESRAAEARATATAQSRAAIELSTWWFSVTVLSVQLACFWLREHLFVWTVFSPKFLYVVAWWAGYHVIGTLIPNSF